MLRFPLRLTVELAKARLARRLHPEVSPIQFVEAAELLHHDSDHPVSHEKIRELVSGRSPVVWIGGSEPLNHPGTAHLVRALTGSRHFVFLETDGAWLRRRIHEFQPVPRLFLTVRLDAGAPLHTAKNLRPNPSELALEGIRAAQLSGFLICVYARVQHETELGQLAELIRFAGSLDADGIVVSPGYDESKTAGAGDASLRSKTADARKLIGSKWWVAFSRLAEPVLSGERNAVQSVPQSEHRAEQETPANEEGVKVA